LESVVDIKSRLKRGEHDVERDFFVHVEQVLSIFEEF